jgi:hypothetical protein
MPTPTTPDSGPVGPVVITLGKAHVGGGHKMGMVLLTVMNSGSSVLQGRILLVGLKPANVTLVNPDGMLNGMPFINLGLPPGGTGTVALVFQRVGRRALVAADLNFSAQLLTGT